MAFNLFKQIKQFYISLLLNKIPPGKYGNHPQ